MAVDHRTLSRFKNASSNFRLMILSSTIKTLIGGGPSNLPIPPSLLETVPFLGRLAFGAGRGDAVRAAAVVAGGVEI